MPEEEKSPAQRAYEAYGKYVNWRNYEGKPMPPWEGLELVTQGAWTAAIKEVLPDA